MPHTPSSAPIRHALAALGALCLAAAVLLGLPDVARAGAARLYGGMPMTSDTGATCPTGFNAQRGDTYLILTGPCLTSGTQWAVDGVPVGTSPGPTGAGYGVVTVTHTDNWAPQGAILVGGQPTSITAAAAPVVGMRVCVPDGGSGVLCGRITDTDLTVNTRTGVIDGVAAANLCLPADSVGEPIVSGSTAIGLVLHGGCSQTLLMPVVTALQDTRSTLL